MPRLLAESIRRLIPGRAVRLVSIGSPPLWVCPSGAKNPCLPGPV
jgi:hypothetical protein